MRRDSLRNLRLSFGHVTCFRTYTASAMNFQVLDFTLTTSTPARGLRAGTRWNVKTLSAVSEYRLLAEVALETWYTASGIKP